MAQKVLLRPFLSFPFKQLSTPLCRQPTLLLWRFSAVPCSIGCRMPLPFTTMPAIVRTFSTTQVFRHTFNIQDGDDFQDRVLKSQTPVVIDFHAQWCGPCKILGPRLEKMVAKHNGKVLMAKVDIDDHTDLALEYEVSAVPTVLAMKNGDVVDKFVGIKDEDQLEAFLKKLIGP
ncbi:thioredoxin, mitochondrial isoform X2 [Pogona vitticeps]|nr:thioredoxin, mitochondrial isoform X2 [Pogona vitticeps]XP_020643414.1 thioredoxin, mitochondrial isoform X2 [Pogona vitticeps]XP_020643415.1 thioredoxin, mitochondrial isoform X2 [Pogona vitticeps]XP_020643416.1 thioredoxin, mitochondrial isoform X2 [Pogona vitticeps]XP_020643417.1 thioredoxin, mitochondrial isoform X2 [Pogona vitticeps]XP_020643418.1 thioredoxin, mitochondrial isoform X2 [Pogona vitticeps]